VVAQNIMIKAWLTTVVTRRKSDKPRITPATERHHAYHWPRKICG